MQKEKNLESCFKTSSRPKSALPNSDFDNLFNNTSAKHPLKLRKCAL